MNTVTTCGKCWGAIKAGEPCPLCTVAANLTAIQHRYGLLRAAEIDIYRAEFAEYLKASGRIGEAVPS